jgi:hypothetical protein
MQIDHLDKGDVTADGIEDTFVTYACQASTSSWPQRIEAFAGTAAGKPVQVGVLFTTDESVSYRSLRLESLSLSPQAVTMRAFGWSSFQPSALPDLIFTQTFRWADGALVGGERSVAPLENEPFTALEESAYPGVDGIETVHDVGLIDGVDTSPLGARIKFDRVIWLWCNDADAIEPQCLNNYDLTNDNDKRRTFILAPDVRILLLDPTTERGSGLRDSTVGDLAALVQSGRTPLCALQRNEAGLVTAIGEVWTP